jgi:hypothetical protein
MTQARIVIGSIIEKRAPVNAEQSFPIYRKSSRSLRPEKEPCPQDPRWAEDHAVKVSSPN